MTEILLAVLIVLNVLGGSGVLRWLRRQIGALRGTVEALEKTVKAQDEALQAVRDLNKTALEMIKAVDPERWAKEGQIHKELADKKVEAVLDEERRKMELDKEVSKQRGLETIKTLVDYYGDALTLGLRLIPYVPKHLRAQVIKEVGGSSRVTGPFLDIAEKAPDWSTGFPSLLSIGQSIFGDVTEARGETPRLLRPEGLDIRSERADGEK